MERTYTWAQAKNMLLCGICKQIRYAPGQGVCNAFESVDGVIYRRYDDFVSFEPGEPTASCKNFIVSER